MNEETIEYFIKSSGEETVFSAWESCVNEYELPDINSVSYIANFSNPGIYYAFLKLSALNEFHMRINTDKEKFHPVTKFQAIKSGFIGIWWTKENLICIFTDAYNVSPELQFLPKPVTMFLIAKSNGGNEEDITPPVSPELVNA